MGETTQAGEDTGEAPRTVPKPEHRWPMALAVLAAILLQVGVPHRGRVPGWWVFPILEAILLVIVIAHDPGGSTGGRGPRDVRRSRSSRS